MAFGVATAGGCCRESIIGTGRLDEGQDVPKVGLLFFYLFCLSDRSDVKFNNLKFICVLPTSELNSQTISLALI